MFEEITPDWTGYHYNTRNRVVWLAWIHLYLCQLDSFTVFTHSRLGMNCVPNTFQPSRNPRTGWHRRIAPPTSTRISARLNRVGSTIRPRTCPGTYARAGGHPPGGMSLGRCLIRSKPKTARTGVVCERRSDPLHTALGLEAGRRAQNTLERLA